LHIPLLSYPERGSDLKVDFQLLYNGRWAQKATTCVEPIDTCGPVMYRLAQVPPYNPSGVYFSETRNPSFINKQIRYTYPNSSFYRYFGPLRTLYQPDGAGHALGNIGTTRMTLPGTTVARPGFAGYAFLEDALNLAKGCFTLFTASKRLFRAKRLRRSDPDIRLESQEKEQIPAFMGWVTRRVPRSDSYPA
jgi:hypothetical protein